MNTMKKLILLTIIPATSFSQLTYAQLSSGNTPYIPEPQATCWHGTESEPFKEIIGIVYDPQPCPLGSSLPHPSTSSGSNSESNSGSYHDHNQNDPDCRITRICGRNLPCESSPPPLD